MQERSNRQIGDGRCMQPAHLWISTDNYSACATHTGVHVLGVGYLALDQTPCLAILHRSRRGCALEFISALQVAVSFRAAILEAHGRSKDQCRHVVLDERIVIWCASWRPCCGGSALEDERI